MTDAVRIQRRVSKKHYLKTKRTYTYERLSLNIPKEFHEAIKSFLERDLEIKITSQNGSLVIMLTCNELSKQPSPSLS